jgi:hypothetical protein
MYTAFPETILDTESNSCASTRFDSEPRKIADAYFVMEFVNAFVFAADEVVALSVVAVAELFFWYRYDDMLFFDFFFFFFSFLTMFLLHREALRSRFHLKSLSVSRSGENIFRIFVLLPFLTFLHDAQRYVPLFPPPPLSLDHRCCSLGFVFFVFFFATTKTRWQQQERRRSSSSFRDFKKKEKRDDDDANKHARLRI